MKWIRTTPNKNSLSDRIQTRTRALFSILHMGKKTKKTKFAIWNNGCRFLLHNNLCVISEQRVSDAASACDACVECVLSTPRQSGSWHFERENIVVLSGLNASTPHWNNAALQILTAEPNKTASKTQLVRQANDSFIKLKVQQTVLVNHQNRTVHRVIYLLKINKDEDIQRELGGSAFDSFNVQAAMALRGNSSRSSRSPATVHLPLFSRSEPSRKTKAGFWKREISQALAVNCLQRNKQHFLEKTIYSFLLLTSAECAVELKQTG